MSPFRPNLAPLGGLGVGALRLRALLAVVVAVLSAASAQAAPLGGGLRKFEEGAKLFAAGQYRAALQAYEASMTLEPSPNTRFKIAKCFVALGKTASAYVNFKRTVQEAQDRSNATGEKRFLPTRDAALLEANALESRVPRLTLVVPADVPDGFSVTVDGGAMPRPVWGIGVETDPGPHTIVATGPRIQRYALDVDLQPGEFKRVDIPLVRLATATIRLVFATRPLGLAVTLDGQPLSPDQFDKPQYVDVGSHKLTVSAPGYASMVWKKSLDDNQSIAVSVKLDQSSASAGGGGVPKAVVFGAAGATLLVLAIGIGFGVKAKNTADEQLGLDPLRRTLAVQDQVRSDAMIANVMFGVGGALAVTTTILALAARWRDSPPARATASVRLDPLVAASGDPALAQGMWTATGVPLPAPDARPAMRGW